MIKKIAHKISGKLYDLIHICNSLTSFLENEKKVIPHSVNLFFGALSGFATYTAMYSIKLRATVKKNT